MLRVFLVCLFLILLYNASWLFSGMYPSAGHNTTVVLFSGESNLAYDPSEFYSTEDGSFYVVCPDVDYQIAYINGRRETLSLLYLDTIFDTNYQPIYKIVDYMAYYELKDNYGNLISTFRHYIHSDNYVFMNEDYEIIGTVTVISGSRSYKLNFTQEVDARLYKMFMIYLSYNEHRDIDTCNVLFFYNIIILFALTLVITILWYCIRRKSDQSETRQRLIQSS